MKTDFMSYIVAAVAVVGAHLPASARAAEFDVSLNTTISEGRPVTVYSGEPRFFKSIDHNWVGGRGGSVKAYVITDGDVAWSGMVPPYDPTFHGEINKVVSHIEIRVEGGEAYIRWAKLYTEREKGYSGNCRPRPGVRCSLQFIGSETEAYPLAWETVSIINHLEMMGIVPPGTFTQLKLAAMEVYSVNKGDGGQHLGDTLNAVRALEMEFAKKEGTINGLTLNLVSQEDGLALKTIRVRFKALFGYSTY